MHTCCFSLSVSGDVGQSPAFANAERSHLTFWSHLEVCASGATRGGGWRGCEWERGRNGSFSGYHEALDEGSTYMREKAAPVVLPITFKSSLNLS